MIVNISENYQDKNTSVICRFDKCKNSNNKLYLRVPARFVVDVYLPDSNHMAYYSRNNSNTYQVSAEYEEVKKAFELWYSGKYKSDVIKTLVNL